MEQQTTLELDGGPQKPGSRHIFVTGVTGFVGKVVLEELLRREEEL